MKTIATIFLGCITLFANAGIFFDPSSSGNNGRTWTLLITPTNNGSIPACGTAQYATTCHRTIRQVCRIGNADTLGPVSEKLPWLGDAFPNPANETVQIPYYLPDENSKAEISLFSTTGQLIADYACMGGSERMLTIDLTHLSPGVYFYSLRSNQA